MESKLKNYLDSLNRYQDRDGWSKCPYCSKFGKRYLDTKKAKYRHVTWATSEYGKRLPYTKWCG